MIDITKLPLEELEQDLADSIEDIRVCRMALMLGITQYSTGSVQERLDVNQQIVEVINAELQRRKDLQVDHGNSGKSKT